MIIAGATPCLGGSCSCDEGQGFECLTGQACDFVDDRVGNFCTGDAARPPSDCGDVGWSGHCEGAVVVYCKEGALRRVDCGQWGMSCGWVDDETGNYCR